MKSLRGQFDTIFFDADDTLWENEIFFRNAEARFKTGSVKRIYFYCNRDGLFYTDVHRMIDGKDASYDCTAERKALEDAAKMIFG